ncbi:4Fe-4S dicluster domain-containing protein [Limisalsivibrio acetivorans]|uniref:4Fe-4S dicluster domain-containing protein n=1 Tax=Limisalsivibrio acetivorans TaxID=1304888 RepID=UPI0003B3BA91|nr:4Fe-4S dicluster domain-containing protein [Limisalsivibrio acetivorans]
MSTQYGFYIDTQHCTGCKACMNACKDRQNLADGEMFRKVYEFAGGGWGTDAYGGFTNDVFTFYVSMACNQCDNPACLNACPASVYSIRESDGVVVMDTSKCISCFACKNSCPYSAPTYDYESKNMKKCIMCTDEKTESGTPSPSCVKACPSRALDFDTIENLKAKYGNVQATAAFPSTTEPNVVYKLHSDSGKGFEHVNPEEVL